MAEKDLYEILGVKKGARADELKRAYRKLAMQYHPDRNQGDAQAEQKFKEVSHAYDILKDDEKRAAYDRFGHAAFEGGSGGPRGGAGGFSFNFGGGFSDIFEEMFGEAMGMGGKRGRGSSGRGADLRYNMELTLEQAFNGSQVTIQVPTSQPCEACGGTGAAEGTVPTTCPTCRGVGKVRAQQGFFTIERTCPTCGGIGKVIETPCKHCGGTGRTQKEKTLKVDIPAGVDDGTRIRLSGDGEAGLQGGQPGDLYIFLSIKGHRLFQRDGADLYCRVPIPMTRAALGGTLEVPTIEGSKARVTVPEGTQSGTQFKLRGKGMSVLRSAQRGDMFVQVDVETPVKLSKKQKELLQAFEDMGEHESAHPESKGWFERVKDFLG